MRRNKYVKKDKNHRKNFREFEMSLYFLKHIRENYRFPVFIRLNAARLLAAKEAEASKVRITNRCSITNRKNVSSHKYRFSRLQLARLVSTGKIYGFKKACW